MSRYLKFVIIFIVIMLIGCEKEVLPVEIVEEGASKQVESNEISNQRIKLQIYCEEDQPRQFINSDGELVGMAIELVKEIQNRVGNTDEIEIVPWARGYVLIQNQPNVVLFCMARIEERENLFHWVGPIDEIAYAFYGKKGSDFVIESLEDAKNVGAIGVISNEVRSIYLENQGFKNLEVANDTIQNYKKLMSGRIDLIPISTDKLELESEIKELGMTVDDFEKYYVFMKTQLYIAMSKATSEDVVNQWEVALDEMKEDGTFDKIYLKYFPGKELPNS